MSLFKLPRVSADRRIACAVSGSLTVTAILFGIGCLFELWQFGKYLFGTSAGFHSVVVMIVACFVDAFALLVLFVVVYAIYDNLKTKKRLRSYRNDTSIAKASSGKRFITNVLPFVLSLLLLANWSHNLPYGVFGVESTDPDPLILRFLVGLWMQAGSGFIFATVWQLLDNRPVVELKARLWSCILLMVLPLYGMYFGGFLAPLLGPTGACWALWLAGMPVVGAALGAAYSCEENIFDKLRFRR